MNLTIRQIELMSHALGQGRSRLASQEVRRFVAKRYRNHFATDDGNPEWEELVELGAAEKGRSIPDAPLICYRVSKAGIAYLDQLIAALGLPPTKTDD